MSKIVLEREGLNKGTIAWRCMGYLEEMQNLGKILETDDTVLLAHLLIIDKVRRDFVKYFKGVEIVRAGKGIRKHS